MSKIALVTGANQGLGLALVRGLCRALGRNAHVYLSARDAGRGRDAVEGLRREGLEPHFQQLDVSDETSVAAAAAAIKARHGGVDIVISNAAARITKAETPAAQVRAFINTNNHGAYRMIRAFAPILNDNARFLIVASSFGSLRHLDRKLWPLFEPATNTLESVEQTMDAYVEAVEQNRAQTAGWPEWINIPSKIGQVASARLFAREVRSGILVNAVCPGLVDTDASRPWFDDMSNAQSPDEAANDVVWLATLPAGERAPHGELVRHREISPWM